MPLGRPRAFDPEKALDQALTVFWKRGYEGTSVSDLTAAMGINPPSLYAVFGNKEALFKRALDRYEAMRNERWQAAFAAPTAREAMLSLLLATADALSDRNMPKGCLIVQGALCCDEDCENVKLDLEARRAAGQAMIRERLVAAKKEGDLPADADPQTLAAYINVVLQGMAVQAAGGANRKDLRAITETAMRAWPA